MYIIFRVTNASGNGKSRAGLEFEHKGIFNFIMALHYLNKNKKVYYKR